jgi:adenylate cyclase
VAGRLGTLDQFKVDVFGPIVNLAARLESMTKRFGVPILIDDACAKRLSGTSTAMRARPTTEVDLNVGSDTAQPSGVTASGIRCRRLARVRPHGMRLDLMVSELLPPESDPDAPPEPQRLSFEAALDAFLAGKWADARSQLETLPKDGANGFLTSFMGRYPEGPPPNWDGVVVIEGK